MRRFAKVRVSRHGYPLIFQTSEEPFHRAVDAPMSRAGDWHSRGPIKSMDTVLGRYSVLGISGSP